MNKDWVILLPIFLTGWSLFLITAAFIVGIGQCG
jgi:hypothetical protein